MKIAAAGNVEAAAYHALIARGYAVTCVDAGDTWIALKDGIELTADGALPLLGLVAMVEARGAESPATDRQIDAYLACLTASN